MLFFAPDFVVLMSGRIITGIGSGLCSPACYIILSEYALVRYRGQSADKLIY
jgi:MFS family permease